MDLKTKKVFNTCDFCEGWVGDRVMPLSEDIRVDSYTAFNLGCAEDFIQICEKCWPKFIKEAKKIKLEQL